MSKLCQTCSYMRLLVVWIFAYACIKIVEKRHFLTWKFKWVLRFSTQEHLIWASENPWHSENIDANAKQNLYRVITSSGPACTVSGGVHVCMPYTRCACIFPSSFDVEGETLFSAQCKIALSIKILPTMYVGMCVSAAYGLASWYVIDTTFCYPRGR